VTALLIVSIVAGLLFIACVALLFMLDEARGALALVALDLRGMHEHARAWKDYAERHACPDEAAHAVVVQWQRAPAPDPTPEPPASEHAPDAPDATPRMAPRFASIKAEMESKP